MARNWRQRLLSFLFDLSFSLACDNPFTDSFEFVGRLLLTPQLVSLVMPTEMLSWSSPRLQNVLKWFLLSFGTLTELHFLLALSIVYFVMIARVSWDVYHQGVAPSSRYLRMSRLLHAACSTFLFIPITYNGVFVLTWIADKMPSFRSNEVPGWTAQMVIFSTILVFCFLLPILVLAALNTPNYSNLTFMTRISSRQQLFTLLVLFTACLCAGLISDLFARIHNLSVLILALFVSAFKFPFYGSGTGNVLTILTLAVPTYVSGLSIALVWTQNPYAQGSDDSQYYHIGSIGFFPFASVCVAVYMLRIQRIVNSSSFWRREFQSLSRYWSAVTKAKQHTTTTHDNDVLPDLNPAILLHNCKSAGDVALVSHLLLFVSNYRYVPQVLELLALSFKKYPESVLIQETAVAIEAFFTDNTAHHRQFVLGTIRRLLGRNLVLPDTQFAFYKVVKMQEISTYRQQDDLRKAGNLDVARYIHNLQSAQSHHTKALQWAVRFWRICSAERPNLDTADFASNSIQNHQSRALKHYKHMLETFPTSVVVLRTYASFVSECLNQQELAESILDYSIKLSEDRAEIVGAMSEFNHTSTPALTRKAASAADKKRPGSRGSDGGDSHSEVSKSSGSNTIDSLSTVDSSSIFDVEGTEEARNSVAMKGVRRLVMNIVLSFVLLLAGVNVIFGMGSVFKTRELSDRNNVLDAGLVRLGTLELAWNARSMDLLLHNSTGSVVLPKRTLAYLQGQIKAVAASTSTSMSGIFVRTAEASSIRLLNYWQTPVLLDPTVSTRLTPSQFLSHLLFKSLRLGNTLETSLTTADPDIHWLVANGLPDSILTFVLGFVKVFQLYYEENIQFRFNSLTASIIAISVIPVAAFLVFFLPVWLRLSSELSASRRLFTRIPRRVAAVLCKEMQECLKEQLEREGVDGTDVIRENDAAKDSSRDESPQSSEMRGGDDDWNNQFGSDRPGSRDLTMWRLLGMYVLTLTVIMGLGIGLAYCYIRPLELARSRASIINYSGMRFALVVRSMMELRELAMLAPDDEQAEQLRSSIVQHVDEAIGYHAWTLYGSTKEGIPRTFGRAPEADRITFSRTCPATNASAACMSVEEALITFTSITRGVVDRRAPVSAHDYDMAVLIGDPQGIIRNPIVQARLVYSELNQGEFNMTETASVVLFSSIFPSLFVVAYVLYKPLDDVAKMIRRVRNILFQLPTETLDPSIRDYLDHGWLRMNGQTWKGKKARDREPDGGKTKRARSHAVNEANRRLQEEGEQWDMQGSRDATERQRKVKVVEVAESEDDEQEAESLAIERIMTRRTSSRVPRKLQDEDAGNDGDGGSKLHVNATAGKEVRGTAPLSPTSPTGRIATLTRRRASVSANADLEPPASPETAVATRGEASLGVPLVMMNAHSQPEAASFDQSMAPNPTPLNHPNVSVRSSNSLSVPNSAQRLDASGSNAPSNASLANRPGPSSTGLTRNGSGNGSGNGSFVRDFNQLPHMLHGGGSLQRVGSGSRHGSLTRQGGQVGGVPAPSRLMNSLQRRVLKASALANETNETDSEADEIERQLGLKHK